MYVSCKLYRNCFRSPWSFCRVKWTELCEIWEGHRPVVDAIPICFRFPTRCSISSASKSNRGQTYGQIYHFCPLLKLREGGRNALSYFIISVRLMGEWVAPFPFPPVPSESVITSEKIVVRICSAGTRCVGHSVAFSDSHNKTLQSDISHPKLHYSFVAQACLGARLHTSDFWCNLAAMRVSPVLACYPASIFCQLRLHGGKKNYMRRFSSRFTSPHVVYVMPSSCFTRL